MRHGALVGLAHLGGVFGEKARLVAGRQRPPRGAAGGDFRGVGFYLLRPRGAWFAITGTGLLFGLSHGLLVALPIIVIFGVVLGWLREQTGSVYPGMFLHSTFNLIALVAAVVPR